MEANMSGLDANLAAKLNLEVRDIWRNPGRVPPEAIEREPLIVHPYHTPGDSKAGPVLFVGMNPSFVLRHLVREFSISEPELRARFRFDPNRSSRDDLEAVASADRELAYFRAFQVLIEDAAKGPAPPWTHVDLFYIRETNQRRVLPWVASGETLNDFGRRQWKITWRIIQALEPSIIIVCNAAASRIFERETTAGGLLDWSDKTGCHLLQLKKSTPVFFSSMLSGQRALDIYNRRRMAWHLRFACDQLDIPVFRDGP